MHKTLVRGGPILLAVALAGCMAATPEATRMYDGYEVAPVARGTNWSGCEAEGGRFAAGDDGGLVCVLR